MNKFIPAVEQNGNLTVTIRQEVPQNLEKFQPYRINYELVAEAIRQLIFWRAEHCQNQLAEKVAKGETFITSPSSDFICYKDGGHFSVPVYKAMTEFLAIEDLSEIKKVLNLEYDVPTPLSRFECKRAKLLCQQALRQLLAMYNDKKLKELHCSHKLLGNILTKQFVVL